MQFNIAFYFIYSPSNSILASILNLFDKFKPCRFEIVSEKLDLLFHARKRNKRKIHETYLFIIVNNLLVEKKLAFLSKLPNQLKLETLFGTKAKIHRTSSNGLNEKKNH